MADRSEIDEIRSRIDIVSLVEQYVTLKRAGRVLKGLCPFHSEKTPSFQVNPDNGMWWCFGQCGEGGDVFKFVQKIENLSFGETLERLALKAGVTLTRSHRETGTDGTPVTSERDRIYKVNTLAMRFYRDALSQFEPARDYLRERGMTEKTQNAFFVGYAPDEWDGLVSYLRTNGVSVEDGELAGLVSVSERGRPYDRMRGRVVFPILDVQERAVAFGGRLMGQSGPDQPKYWNSPETRAFSKSHTLYGLWRGRKAIADSGQAIVVEGYTDVVAAHQAGFENVVATLGTSLTEEHVKILQRLAPKVVLAFDADSAGLKAAFRAGEIFTAQNVEVRVLTLPEGEDPDSLLRAGKREVFAEAITNAQPLIEYRLRRLIGGIRVDNDQDRIDLFKKALPILRDVPSMFEREPYIKLLVPHHPRISEGAAFVEARIWQDLASLGDVRAEQYRSEIVKPSSVLGEGTKAAENLLMSAILSGDTLLATHVFNSMRPDDFIDNETRDVARQLYDYYETSGSLDSAAMIASIDERFAGLLTGIMIADKEPLTITVLNQNIKYLKSVSASAERALLRERVNSGNASIDEMRRYHQLIGGGSLPR